LAVNLEELISFLSIVEVQPDTKVFARPGVG
jgi:hypothetical protein